LRNGTVRKTTPLIVEVEKEEVEEREKERKEERKKERV
jgi:ribosomal protein S30